MSDSASLLATPILDSSTFHTSFIRKAGLVYGAVFAIGFATIFWGLDAIAFQQASVHLAWGKFLLGLASCLPISMLVGWLAASARWSAISIVSWILGGIIVAWAAGHVPFDGLSWLSGLGDPYPPGRTMYPFTLSAAAFTGISMVIGAGAGLFVGLLSLIATERAWNQSTASQGFSVRSILMLCLCLPPVIVFGLLADFQINSSTRLAMVDVDQAIKTALDPERNLNEARLVFLKSYRGQMTPHYSLYWVRSSADLDSTTVDVQFDNGLFLRCQHSFGFVSLCVDLGHDLHDWMAQIATAGHLTCTGCNVQIDRDTRRWLAAVLPTLGAPPGTTPVEFREGMLRDVTFLKHQGGWLYERAAFDNGRVIDCRFSGNGPIWVDLCVEAR